MSAAVEDAWLVLNLGSATLKAARFVRQGADFARCARLEIAVSDGPANSQALLLHVAGELGFEAPPMQIGHRIVHGGGAATARILDAAELERVRKLARLAPLHQPPALALIAEAATLWPGVSQYAAFDTSWHAGLPANARRLPVPQAWDAQGVRRYGFHGLAFASAMRLLDAHNADGAQGRVVLAHLGGGASLCGVSNGRSVDTTMAMTPLEGLPMATRSGSLDPGVLLFLLRDGGYSIDALEQALYRECGLRGLSGLSGDVRELLDAKTEQASLALDVFALRVAQGIAAMATHLGGIDDLVFSGGIGANAAPVRSSIVRYLSWLGLALDDDANRNHATRLSPPDTAVRIWRIMVDEEGEIAAACAAVAHG